MRRTPFGTACPLFLALMVLVAGAGCQDEDTPAETARVQQAPGQGVEYVALGDSYSAAPGVPETDPANPCMRSTNNYPSMVADRLSVETFVDVTCGGATTKDMTQPQHQQVPPQLDALTRETDLVTLGIGGNDSQVFFHAIYQCTFLADQDPDGSPCQDAITDDGTDVDAVLAETTRRIVAVVQKITRRSPEAEVLLVGYPQLVPAQGTCAALPLAEGDYPFARSVNKRLTEALAAAAKQTEAGYVDLWTASAGHDVCADEPWVNGAESNEHAAAFHPRIEEQEAAADLVVKAFRTSVA